MRKLLAACLFVGLTVSSLGCVMVIGTRDLDDDLELVEIDGELYVKDESTHRVRRIDRSTTTESETTSTTDTTTKP